MKDKFFEIVKYRELMQSLVSKNLNMRYHGSALGCLWSLLNQFLIMALYTVVFAFFLRIKVEHYPLFLISTMVPWSFFSASLQQGTQSLVGHGEFIKKMYCPRELFPLSVVVTNSVVLLLSLAGAIPFILYFKGGIGLALLLLPAAILIHMAFIVGIVLISSCLHVFYRDVAHILDFLLVFWFYLTPIVYPLSLVPEHLQIFFYLNPMFHILTLYREIIYAGNVPTASCFLISTTVAAVSLGAGWKVFLSLEQAAAKEL